MLCSPKGLRKRAQGCGATATLGAAAVTASTPQGLRVAHPCETPLGFREFAGFEGRCAATLGCVTEARWAIAAEQRVKGNLRPWDGHSAADSFQPSKNPA